MVLVDGPLSLEEILQTGNRLSTPIPRRRLDGCACTSPPAHFYIYHSDSSLRELHSFTTTTHLASQDTITHHREDYINIQILFRSRSKQNNPAATETAPAFGFAPSFFALIRRIKGRKSYSQWTDRLAGVAHEQDISTAQSSFDGPEHKNHPLRPLKHSAYPFTSKDHTSH
jgi:hypothetical protein